MKVYKYFKPQYLTANSIGMFFLSTFESIRGMEAKNSNLKGPTIDDVNEGVTKIQGPISRFEKDDNILSNDPEKLKAIEKLGIVKIRGGTFFADENCTFSKSLPNAYMYSVTSHLDHRFWLSVDPNYKCCMEIKDFAEFHRRILSKLNPEFFKGYQDFCIYSDDVSEPNYFRKKLTFQRQHELRSVFLPKKLDAELHENLPLIPKTIAIKIDDLIEMILV